MNMLGMKNSNENKLRLLNPKFEIQISDLSHISTMIKFNPNRDIVEDR